jgi:signal transduction histidine kinase
VEALAVPALLIGTDDDILAGELFGPGSTAARRKFKELPASWVILGLRALVQGVKTNAASSTLTDVSWAAGREHNLDLTAAPVSDGDGRVRAVLLTAVDRSDQLAARSELEELRAEHGELQARYDASAAELQSTNEELASANEELRQQVSHLAAAEEADIRKNQFLAMLAHELRNPLAAALNALHVIRRAAPAVRPVQQAVRIAERQLRHEARLLDDLLDVSRIVLGKVAVDRRSVELRDIVRTAVEGADHAVRARALQVSVKLGDEPLVVTGDATRLEQCVGNLLSNAVKFTPPGGTVSIRAGRDGSAAVVTVRDSGVGISPDMLERVFDLFTQGDPSLARAQGGLGIGLTLVRHLVDLQGGRVSARSEGRGHGSEFEIRLPLSDAPADVPAPETEPATGPRRILIVDDNRDAREMLRAVLELHGHIVSDTGDGTAAVRLATESAPDIVVCDIGLPDLDGFEVARRIRRRRGADVRLVALSGYGDEDARRTAREAGFDAHLVKPVPSAALLRALDPT